MEIPSPPQPTIEAIYRAFEDAHKAYPSARIGASALGGECERALWYSFRWVAQKRFIGRMLRLFQTGHLQESRMVADLRAAGVTVLDVDPDTGKQWSRTDESGHIVCKLDGAAVGLLEAPKTWHVVELKTYNKKTFDKLVKEGVKKSKPEHWWQCQIGMHLTGMTRAYYLAVCKDDERMHAERLEYNAEACIRVIAKGQRIKDANSPPGRISDDPAWFGCKFCDFHGQCHKGEPSAANCRTCIFSSPIEGGKWRCERWNVELSLDDQKAGCATHLFIPALIHGEQIDASVDGSWIKYRMPDGSEWIDGAAT